MKRKGSPFRGDVMRGGKGQGEDDRRQFKDDQTASLTCGNPGGYKSRHRRQHLAGICHLPAASLANALDLRSSQVFKTSAVDQGGNTPHSIIRAKAGHYRCIPTYLMIGA